MSTLKKQYKIPPIGMRIIKSAIGVFICFLIDILRGNGGIVFYSQLAVLWCVRDYVSETRKFALQRTIGTVVGAVYGLIALLCYQELQKTGWGSSEIVFGIYVSIFIIVIIYTTVVIRQKQASYFTCVVFLSIVVNHFSDANPYLFAWNRFLDTMIGILVGVAVNNFELPGKRDKDTLFISGVDDILLSSGESISDYSKVELNRMIESGMKFTVSTIRTPASLMEPLRGLKLSLPVIAMDGAALYNIGENRYEKVYVITPEHCAVIEKFFEERSIPYFSNVVIDDVLLIYYQETMDAYYNLVIAKLRKSPYRNYIKRNIPPEESVVYFMVVGVNAHIQVLYRDMISNPVFSGVKIVMHPSKECPGCLELKIYSHNASKENMIDYLLQTQGIQKCETFGTIQGKYTHVIDPGDFNRVVKLMKK